MKPGLCGSSVRESGRGLVSRAGQEPGGEDKNGRSRKELAWLRSMDSWGKEKEKEPGD